jgi:hypothetical protein
MQKLTKYVKGFANFLTCGVAFLIWILLGICPVISLLLGGRVSISGITDTRTIMVVGLIVTVGLFLLFAIPFIKSLLGADKTRR